MKYVTIKAGETYLRRDGKLWRCYATDGHPIYPNHGAVKEEDGWIQLSMSKFGTLKPSSDSKEEPWDLVAHADKRLEVTGWVNVYVDRGGETYYDFYRHKENADNFKESRVACIPVSGEGRIDV